MSEERNDGMVRHRNVPAAPGRALDFVNRVERMRWVPRHFVRHLMQRYVDRHCEPHHRQVLQSVGRGDVVLDLGANVGLFSMYFGQRGATVHAFEPDPSAVALLRRHAAPFPNIHVHQKAVFDKPGQMRLYRHKQFKQDANYAQSSTLVEAKRNVDPQQAVDVEVEDIAQVMARISGPVRLLKIDIEGAEAAVLERLLDTGNLARIEHVLVETHEDIVPGLGDALDRLKDRLASAGHRQVDFSWY